MVFNILKKIPFIGQKQSAEEFVHEMREENKHTPDRAILEHHKELLLFVPDAMRRGAKKYELIRDTANYRATAFTDDTFFPFVKDLGTESTEVVLRHLPSGHIMFPPEPARLKGELFTVNDPKTFVNLDEYKENGVQFERKRVEIIVPTRLLIYSSKKPLPNLSDVRLMTISAYMYVGVQSYWDPLLGGVFPAKTARLMETPTKWIDKYYFYAKGNEL